MFHNRKPVKPRQDIKATDAIALDDPAVQEKTEQRQELEQVQKDTKSHELRMHIKVYSPFHTYYNEDAYSISAINDTGPFDILPKHYNFMTLLNAGEMVIRGPRGDQKILISRGVMHVRADEVIVFLDV